MMIEPVTARKQKKRVEYSDELAEEICLRVAEGENMTRICRPGRMPHVRTIHNWRLSGKHPDFTRQFGIARLIAAETMYDDLITVAKSAKDKDGPGVRAVEVLLNQMKWNLMKMNPKEYGDRIDVNHTASDAVKSIMETVQEAPDIGIGPAKSRQKPEDQTLPDEPNSVH